MIRFQGIEPNGWRPCLGWRRESVLPFASRRHSPLATASHVGLERSAFYYLQQPIIAHLMEFAGPRSELTSTPNSIKMLRCRQL